MEGKGFRVHKASLIQNETQQEWDRKKNGGSLFTPILTTIQFVNPYTLMRPLTEEETKLFFEKLTK